MANNKFEYEGTLTRVDSFTTNKGREILTLVFHEDGQWPKWISAKVFGRLAESSSEWTPGATLRISGRLSGREYNGKIYPENVAEYVEVMSNGAPASQKVQVALPPDEDLDTPF